MSVSNEAPDTELSVDDDIQKQRYTIYIVQIFCYQKETIRWFFTLLSESQAETILNEGSSGRKTRTSRFLVSNLPSSKDYRISIRLGC